MVKHLLDNIGFFHIIPHSTSQKQIHQVLTHVSKNQLQAVGQLFVNILYGILPITNEIREKLYKYRKVIEYLADRHNSIKKRKKLLLRKKRLL